MWRALRIAILLFVLLTVALGAWRESTRSQSWENTLRIRIYPINADGRERTAAYIRQLSVQDFSVMQNWFESQAARYGIQVYQPIHIELAPPMADLPPTAPTGGSAIENVLWSLHMRYWVWRHQDDARVQPNIRLYAQYYDPDTTTAVDHSVGLRKGMIGIAHLFASRLAHGGNTVVLTHELLHTLGASDKYDPQTLQPRFPDGYAEPDLDHVLPQRDAEIMGGRIPITENTADIPRHLTHTVVGAWTAAEIGWPATPVP